MLCRCSTVVDVDLYLFIGFTADYAQRFLTQGKSYTMVNAEFYFSYSVGYPMLKSSVAEPHHFYAAPAPILLYSKAKFLKRT
jgi:hypothetical protein